MRILLTNATLAGLAGSELYVYDLAVELKRLGHDVTCFSLELGLVADRLKERGIRVESKLQSLPTPDIIHAHHRLETHLVAARFPDTPLVYVCHGVLPGPERPGSGIAAFASRVIAVSEDVRRHLVSVDGVAPELTSVVPNFVDTERFRAQRPVADTPRRVLVISNHWGEGLTRETVESACRLTGGLELRVIGKATESVWDVETHIEWADVVVTLGRGALQAMAMGRPTVVFDYRGGDGRVTPDNFNELAASNFSGRARGRCFNARELAGEITGYRRHEVDELTARVLTERSVGAAAERLLSCYSDARDRALRAWSPELRQARHDVILSSLAECTAELVTPDGKIHGRLERELMAQRELVERISRGRVMRAMNAAHRAVDAIARLGTRPR